MKRIFPIFISLFFFSCGNNHVQDGIRKSYWENHQIKSEEKVSGGKLNGESKYYFEKGGLYQTKEFRNDTLNGEVRTFYPSGKLKESTKYLNGVKDGDWLTCFENGHFSEKGKYKSGKKEGSFSYYDMDGNLKQVIIYNHDINSGWMEFDPSGKIVRSSVAIKMNFLEKKDFSVGKTIPIELVVTNSSSQTNPDSLIASVTIRTGNDSTITRFPLTKDSVWKFNYVPELAGRYYITSSVAEYSNSKEKNIFRSKQKAEFIVKDK
jgi:antitoxin component YwqK of YwqJK toxin-antitoxin module